MKYKCILFDCDGVLVDSETISSRIFMEMSAELGFEINLKLAIEKFAGVSMKNNLQFIADNIEKPLPLDFEKQFRKRTYEAFKTELKPIEGIVNLLNKVKVPFCTASSGPQEKIKLNLTKTGLIHRFENRIYSSYDIGSWKPEPGIFLYAAKEMGFKPGECVVIEDSEAGIRAAKAGGFVVFGLANNKKRSIFEKLGAKVFFSMKELESMFELN